MPNLDNYYLQAKFDGSNWETFTNDVVSSISINYGISGNDFLDRIGSVGEMSFYLNNTESNSVNLVGYYSPFHVNCRPGLEVGLRVRLRLVYDGVTITKFEGRVPAKGIQVGTGVYGQRFTFMKVSDWMEQTAIQELSGMGLASNKTMAEAIPPILAKMPIQPTGSIEYGDCESIFPTVNDTIRQNTTALAEFAKLATSELGYVFLNRRGLQVQGRFTRTLQNKAVYPKHSSECDVLALSDGTTELELASGDTLQLSEVFESDFTNSQKGMELQYGKTVYNRVKFTAYPRKMDASATTVLFNLENAIEIGAGETAIVRGRYRDPSNKASSVSGTSMVTPVATTHYKMYENSDGTGTDLTADLTVTATFGTGDFVYELTNAGATKGYITFLTAVGKGIYIYDPMSYLVEDTDSIDLIGSYGLNVDMKYQNDPIVANGFANITLNQYKSSNYSIESVSYVANRSYRLLGAFVYLEPGDKISIMETVSGIANDYFIHKLSAEITVGGLIKYSWVLKDAGFDSYSFWELGIDGFSELGSSTVLSL